MAGVGRPAAIESGGETHAGACGSGIDLNTSGAPGTRASRCAVAKPMRSIAHSAAVRSERPELPQLIQIAPEVAAASPWSARTGQTALGIYGSY